MKFLIYFFVTNLFASTFEFSAVLNTADKVYVSVVEKNEGKLVQSSLYSFVNQAGKVAKLELIKKDEREIIAFMILAKTNLYFTQETTGAGDNIQVFENEKPLKELACTTLSKIYFQKQKIVFECRNYPTNGEEFKKVELAYPALNEMLEVSMPFLASLDKASSVEIADDHLAKMDQFNLVDSKTKKVTSFKLKDFSK